MSVCHVLSEVGKNAEERAAHLKSIEIVLGRMGFAVEIHGKELVKDEDIPNFEAQGGLKDGARASFVLAAPAKLADLIHKGDLIIATESWQHDCFLGLLHANKGLFGPAPVIEMWIDYPLSFARYRIFSTRFAMYATAGIEGVEKWTPEWVAASPYIPAVLKKESFLNIAEFGPDKPYSLKSLETSALGVPVLAPDWGSWAETVEHGVSGALYRTPGGKELSREIALGLKGQDIVKWVNENFSLETSVEQARKYLTWLANG